MIPKKIIILLFLLAIGLAIADAILDPSSTAPVIAHPLALISSIALFLAWLGAIINAIKVRSWKWFLALFFLAIYMLPVYLFIGPDPTRTENSPQYWESHTIPRKIIALLYVLGLGLMIIDAILNPSPPYSTAALLPMLIGAMLYLIAWITALVNTVKARNHILFITLLVLPLTLFTLPVYILLGTGPTQEANKGSPTA